MQTANGQCIDGQQQPSPELLRVVTGLQKPLNTSTQSGHTAERQTVKQKQTAHRSTRLMDAGASKLPGPARKPIEVVKRRSKRHEYVEVDGFHFRRKRRVPPSPTAVGASADAVAAAGAAAAAASAGPAGAFDTTTTTKHSPAAIKHALQLEEASAAAAAAADSSPATKAHVGDCSTHTPACDDTDGNMPTDQQDQQQQLEVEEPATGSTPAPHSLEAPAVLGRPSAAAATAAAGGFGSPAAAAENLTAAAAEDNTDDVDDVHDDPEVAAALAAAAAAAAAEEAAKEAAAAAAQEVAELCGVHTATGGGDMTSAALAPADAADAGAAGVAAAQPVVPASFTLLPSDLCHMVQAYLSSELARLPGFTPESAQAAGASIRQSLAEGLRQLQQQQAGSAEDAAAAAPACAASAAAGTGACTETAAGGVAAGDASTGSGCGTGGGGAVQQQQQQQAGATTPLLTVLPYQVEQLKAKLQDKRDKLLQEQAAWEQLLQHYKAMAGTEEDGAANPEASSAAAPAAADADADATMVAAMEIEGQGDQKQQQQPVEGQRHGRQGAGAAAADDDPDANPAGVAIAQEELAAAGGGTTAAPGPVSYEQESVLRGVQLKVEALTALVAKMEHLVSRAEATARTLQAGYRAEKFSMFPHVDSPAVLIKSLTAASHQQG